MAYADKRKGELTGKWIGERVRSGSRMRARFSTKDDAEKWEATIDTSDASTIAGIKGSVPYPLAFIARQARLSGAWKLSRDSSLGQRLEVVLDHFGANSAPEVVTTQVMQGFVKDLSTRKGRTDGKLSAKTINRYLAVVSGLLEFARLRGWSAHNPRVPWQQEVQRPIKALNPATDAQLLATLGSHRLQVTAKVFLSGALKSGELFSLRPEQITLDGDWAWLVVGRDEHQRSVPLPRDLAKELQDLIRSKQMPDRAEFYQSLKAAYRELGLDSDLNVTTLRQTALKRAGKVNPTHILKEFAGHRSYRTTLNYVEPVTAEDVAKLASTINEETKITN